MIWDGHDEERKGEEEEGGRDRGLGRTRTGPVSKRENLGSEASEREGRGVWEGVWERTMGEEGRLAGELLSKHHLLERGRARDGERASEDVVCEGASGE